MKKKKTNNKAVKSIQDLKSGDRVLVLWPSVYPPGVTMESIDLLRTMTEVLPAQFVAFVSEVGKYKQALVRIDGFDHDVSVVYPFQTQLYLLEDKEKAEIEARYRSRRAVAEAYHKLYDVCSAVEKILKVIKIS